MFKRFHRVMCRLWVVWGKKALIVNGTSFALNFNLSRPVLLGRAPNKRFDCDAETKQYTRLLWIYYIIYEFHYAHRFFESLSCVRESRSMLAVFKDTIISHVKPKWVRGNTWCNPTCHTVFIRVDKHTTHKQNSHAKHGILVCEWVWVCVQNQIPIKILVCCLFIIITQRILHKQNIQNATFKEHDSAAAHWIQPLNPCIMHSICKSPTPTLLPMLIERRFEDYFMLCQLFSSQALHCNNNSNWSSAAISNFEHKYQAESLMHSMSCLIQSATN